MIQINLITKQKHDHSFRKQTYGYQRGKVGGGRNNLGVWNWPIHTTIFKIYLKRITNKDLCIAEGTLLNIL